MRLIETLSVEKWCLTLHRKNNDGTGTCLTKYYDTEQEVIKEYEIRAKDESIKDLSISKIIDKYYIPTI